MSQKLDLGDPSEPYNFTELVRKNPAWVTDFVNTVPTKPADFNDPHLDRRPDRDMGMYTGLAWSLPLSAAIIAGIVLAIIYF